MKYRIEFAASVPDDLESVPAADVGRILRKIQRLEDGLAGNVKRLQNADVAYRLRMGNYRVLFDVVGDRVIVQAIGHRKDVYE
jgi:mRNA interferase RelE/StbE